MPLPTCTWVVHAVEASVGLAKALEATTLDEARPIAQRDFVSLVKCRGTTPLHWLGLSRGDLLKLGH